MIAWHKQNQNSKSRRQQGKIRLDRFPTFYSRKRTLQQHQNSPNIRKCRLMGLEEHQKIWLKPLKTYDQRSVGRRKMTRPMTRKTRTNGATSIETMVVAKDNDARPPSPVHAKLVNRITRGSDICGLTYFAAKDTLVNNQTIPDLQVP